MRRREFMITGGAAAGALAIDVAAQRTRRRRKAPPPGYEFDFDEATIAQLQRGMRHGVYTSRSLCRAYLQRIAALDKRGPAVNAIIELNPDALAIADALDRERRQKGERGMLHGIPVLIKDNIDTADRMHTTAGSLALARSIAPRDAFVAERLRAAGAVILGKTNLSEWANFRSTHSVSGWSGRGKQTLNPYALDRNPCGSSSGSAVAVAANMCVVAVGTETDGSVVCPSSVNGIVGIKPTVGLVSRSGIIPISATQDTAGPMARSVADAAILLSALAGVDERDPATAAAAGKTEPDYTRFLDPRGLRGARIGVARKFFGFNAAVDQLIEDAIAVIRRQGAEVTDADLGEMTGLADAELQVMLYEFKDGLNRYLNGVDASLGVRTLADLIRFDDQHRGEEMPYFGQELFLMADKKGPLTDKDYKDAFAKCQRLARTEGIDAAMEKNHLDAVIGPTSGPAWLIDWVNGDSGGGGCSTPPAVAGYPHITVPAGFIFGLPVGLSFFGPAWSEPTLIKLAYSFEQATKARQLPQFFKTVDYRANS